jgi:S1-C subfamily serine protease
MERIMRNRWPPPVHQEAQAPEAPPSRLEALRARLGGFYTRFHVIFLVAAMVIIAFASVLIYDATRPPPQRLTQRDIDAAVERSLATATPKPSYASQAYEIIRPSVVRVEATTRTADGKTETSVGTGVVVDDTGTILTCLHVVRDAAEVRVTFADGTESAASIEVAQPENDLAVLRPEVIPDDVVPATLASSATLRVGDEVAAVGNPFGIADSLSAGVVSGLGRSFQSPKTGETLTDLIQFDAAVNPGNSGGPLVNRNGEVVGIVTALLNPTDQDVFIGIGFAIPIETAGGAAGAPPV